MEEQNQEIGEYLDIIKRRKWSLILPAILVMLVAGSVAVLLPAVYQSSAVILIEEQDIPADFVMTTVTGYAEQRIQSIQQRIMRSAQLNDIINRFNLYADFQDRWSREEILQRMRQAIRLELISADTIDRRTGRPTAATIAFTLSYEGDHPGTVQRVTDTLVTLFLSENLEVRQRQVGETTAFLEEEAQRVRLQLEELEAKIAAFKEVHINSLPEMLAVNVRALDNYQARAERIDEQIRMLREREGYLETQLAGIPEVVDSERQRLRQLELALVDLQTRFTAEYPDVRRMQREIAELRTRLADRAASSGNPRETPDNPAYITLAAQLSSTQVEIRSLIQQRVDFVATADEYRRRIENTPKIEMEYNGLVLDRRNTQAKYEDLVRKSMEANVAMGLERDQKGERFTLIEPARMPEKPFKPNRMAIVLLGIVLGIGFGVGCAALREFSDQTIYNPKGLARVSSLPLLVSIPAIITPLDRRKRRFGRLAWSVTALIIISAGVFAFHTYVMDLDIFWTKLMRKAALL